MRLHVWACLRVWDHSSTNNFAGWGGREPSVFSAVCIKLQIIFGPPLPPFLQTFAHYLSQRSKKTRDSTSPPCSDESQEAGPQQNDGELSITRTEQAPFLFAICSLTGSLRLEDSTKQVTAVKKTKNVLLRRSIPPVVLTVCKLLWQVQWWALRGRIQWCNFHRRMRMSSITLHTAGAQECTEQQRLS